jgi:hypothetical protein
VLQRRVDPEQQRIARSGVRHAIQDRLRRAIAEFEEAAVVWIRPEVHAHRHETPLDHIAVPVVMMAGGRREAVDESAEPRDRAAAGDRVYRAEDGRIVERQLQQGRRRIGHHAQIDRRRVDVRMDPLDELRARHARLDLGEQRGLENAGQPHPVARVEV